MIQGKRIFLTGGAGFIGTKLCEALYQDNEILIYDNLNRNSIQHTALLDKQNVRFYKGDILDANSLLECMQDFKPQIVVHLAAVAGVDSVIRDAVNTMKVNLIGTYHVLEAIQKSQAPVERVIDFSTSEVFGSYAYKVDEQSSTTLSPVGEARWTYSASKLAGEHFAHSYYKVYGMPVTCVRPFNIYGPGQVGEGAIHIFIDRALHNLPLEVHGDGDQIRSWCYVDDFIQGVLLCMVKDGAVGNTFNIGNPKGTVTIAMLAELIKRISGSDSDIVYIPKPYVDVELRIPSIEKAVKVLGYNPEYSLSKGLEKTIEWYRSKKA